jgi:hypothetical protein
VRPCAPSASDVIFKMEKCFRKMDDVEVRHICSFSARDVASSNLAGPTLLLLCFWSTVILVQAYWSTHLPMTYATVNETSKPVVAV